MQQFLHEILVQILHHTSIKTKGNISSNITTLRSYESRIVATPTSTSTSIVAMSGWRLWGSWRCIASIICSGASLVGVTRVVALGADYHCWASFWFIHVVPNPPFLPSSNTLAQFWIKIRYVHCIFLGVFSERTPHEVALKSVVPSVHKGFLFVVLGHVTIVVEISNFITCSDHMCAWPV